MNSRVQVIFLLTWCLFAIYNVFGCIKDSECWSFEKCCSNGACLSSCKGKNCTFFSDCAASERCCSGFCQTGISCSCSSSYACGTGRSCCDSRCRLGDNCLGYSCFFESDCDIGETCCDSVCTLALSCNVGSALAGWMIAIIVIIVLLVFGIPITCVVAGIFCAIGPCRKRSRGRVTAQNSTVVTTTTATANTLPGQNPPSATYPMYQPPPGQYAPCPHPAAGPQVPLQPGYNPHMQYPPPPTGTYGPPPQGVIYQPQPGAKRGPQGEGLPSPYGQS